MKKLLLITISFLMCTNSFGLSVDVHELQRRLKTYGYYSGEINGIISNEVVNAIKQFTTDMKTCPKYVDQETCGLILGFEKRTK